MSAATIAAANQLAALLHLLAREHQDLRDHEAQAAVAWLLPLAARMADDVVALVEEHQLARRSRSAE